MRIPMISMMFALSTGVAAQTGTSVPVPPASSRPASPEAAMHKSAIEDSKAECIKMWDAGTHMTKQEWANTCARIQTRLESLKVDDLDVSGTGVRRKPGGKQGSIDPQTRAN